LIETDSLISQKACKVYEARNPSSVKLIVCLKLFKNTKEGYKVKGFY
jgi:hypothetical protein